jgi:hypothetical protein
MSMSIEASSIAQLVPQSALPGFKQRTLLLLLAGRVEQNNLACAGGSAHQQQ